MSVYIYTHTLTHPFAHARETQIIYSSIFPLAEVGIKIPDVYYF